MEAMNSNWIISHRLLFYPWTSIEVHCPFGRFEALPDNECRKKEQNRCQIFEALNVFVCFPFLCRVNFP